MTRSALPSGHPILPEDSLLLMLPVPEPQATEIAKKLALLTREQLDSHYRKHVWAGRRRQAWVIAEEFTRREIPPSFRPSAFLDGQPRLPMEDLFIHDLQWLGHRYPGHRPFLTRYSALFRPAAFLSAARWFMRTGLRTPSYYLKALTLTEDQQTECIYARGVAVRERMAFIDRDSEEVGEILKIANRMNPWARSQPAATWKTTVKRRHDIWRCGVMAGWRPQRTAQLYTALTGENMSRSLAGKVIEEVHRDHPPSKPKPKRSRMRRPPAPRAARAAPPMGLSTKVRRGKKRKAAKRG